MKTQDELNYLKGNWRNDPCWDIEETEGFEEHREELLKYRLEMEAYWTKTEEERSAKRCKELGIEGNTRLLYYLEGLERIINELREDFYNRR